MGEIVRVLNQLTVARGIKMRLNTTVSRIRVKDGCATGVELEGG
ncbi:MAG: hypothetical protein ACRYF4_03080 [Janthinobacterium lividum]